MGRPHLCGVSSTISPSSNEKAVTALPARTMSALGQKQTSAVQKGHVRFTPKSTLNGGSGMSAKCHKRTLHLRMGVTNWQQPTPME